MVLRTNQPCRRKLTATMWLCVCLAVLSRGTVGRAGDTLFATTAAPLLRTYCADCHGDESAEAGLNLAALVQQPDFGARFRTWEISCASDGHVQLVFGSSCPPDPQVLGRSTLSPISKTFR